MYDVNKDKYLKLKLAIHWLPKQHMLSFSIKYKIIFRFWSKVTPYTVGFGEKTAKSVHIEIPTVLVTVFVAPSNKGKQLYQQCFAII